MIHTNKLTKYQKQLLKIHNAEMKVITDTAIANGLSSATLYYAAKLGIIGIPWVINPPPKS